MTGSQHAAPLRRRITWFLSLWAASVLTLAIAAGLLRLVLSSV